MYRKNTRELDIMTLSMTYELGLCILIMYSNYVYELLEAPYIYQVFSACCMFDSNPFRTLTATKGASIAGVSMATLLLFAPLAFAASPHFIGTPTIIKNPNFSIAASFKAAGLANIVSQAFLSSSGGTANLQCVNPGGNNPPPKTVSFGPLQGQKVDIQPRNGQITATTGPLGPPPVPSASQICPNPNWSVAILSVTYTNVVLHIQQNGVDILTFNFGTVTVP